MRTKNQKNKITTKIRRDFGILKEKIFLKGERNILENMLRNRFINFNIINDFVCMHTSLSVRLSFTLISFLGV